MASPGAENDGESERTEALFRAHGPAVTALCRSLLRDRTEAEDAAQQVFLSAHRALLNGAAPREPLAWLLAVARHECYARFRQRAAAPLPAGAAPEAATPDASVHAVRAGELASLWDEVGRMPAAQREAFLLREIRGLSYGQLADELSLSRPSVRSLLLRARARLRQRLGDVATALGGVPWVQALLRLGLGGDATSTVPVATKAVVVGLGAAAIAGGSGAAVPRIAHHASRTAVRHPAAHHRTATHTHRAAAPHATFVDTRREDRSGSVAPTARRHDGSRDSGSDGSGSRDGGGDDAQVTAPAIASPVVVQPTTTGDGSDGGDGSSSAPGPGTATTTVSDSSGPGPSSSDGDGGDGGSSGSSDGGSDGHGG
ncbi:MAG TPA: sigma-70 family RNA polymerase sigma factor [Gaiellaceae bacterium]|nr:sigma-70 family RNA polymerase sigma factor [Gaiellaceae bacterium]